MKILHTSDIHIGKKLNNFNLNNIHSKYFEKLKEICARKEIDIVLIAGDVFNVPTPDFESEKIFYKALNDLNNNGERLIIVCAGNHDSHKKIDVASPLSLDKGILFIPTISSKVNNGENFENEIFKLYDIEEGAFRLKFKGKDVSVVSLGYPSLENINFYKEHFDDNKKISYKEKITKILELKNEYFKDDTINLFLAHIYVGGTYEFCESETDFNVGGLYDIESKYLPKKADYIALGHLHKKQKIKGYNNAFYCGSPFAFSKSEANQKKYVIVSNIKDKQIEVEEVQVELPISVKSVSFKTIEDLIDFCNSDKHLNKYMFITLADERYFGVDSDLYKNNIKNALKNIELLVEFHVKENLEEDDEQDVYEVKKEINIYEEFELLAKKEISDIDENKIKELFTLFDEILKG